MIELTELLKKTKLFERYSDPDRKAIAQELVLENFKAKAPILNEGDIGDRLHIIVSGSVRVFTHDKDGNEIVLARLEKGDYFGEQALLAEHPIRRNASVLALTDVQTASLTYKTFQKYLKNDENLLKFLHEVGKNQLIKKFLELSKEQSDQESEIYSLFKKIERFGDREVFFFQGEESLNAYLLLDGLVEIRFYDADRRVKSHTFIHPGQFFGELGVLEKKPRSGTAISSGESQVAIIDPKTLEELYKKNRKLNAMITTQRSLYQVPAFGLITQYQGYFLGKPAIHTTIHKLNGEILTCSRLISSSVFSISYPMDQATQKEVFQDAPEHIRTILLDKNHLIGVISIGVWDDLAEVFNQVKEKVEMTDRDIELFNQSGKLHLFVRSNPKEGNLCECMQVKTATIQKLISEGCVTLEEISKKTGAGTVCGGCRPRIIELSGGNAWTYVKIANIKEHNDRIRSYQFQPLSGRLPPYKAGQHIVVEANIEDRWVARSYTLTSIDEYEITVKREDKGYFSNWLFKHDKENILLRVSAPQGEFVFQPEASVPALCLMAGIGITPSAAFARSLLKKREKRELHIDYSVHRAEEAIFQNEFSNWHQQSPNISVELRVTGEKGHISESQIRSLLGQYRNADIYICGPKSYENSLKDILGKIGVSGDKVHVEEFTHAGEPLRK